MRRAIGLEQRRGWLVWVAVAGIVIVLAGSQSAAALDTGSVAAPSPASHRQDVRDSTRGMQVGHVEVRASAATYVESFRPNRHFEGSRAIKVGRSHRGRVEAYLRFQIASVPASARNVSARLLLSARGGGPSVLRLRRASGAQWSPHRLTWRRRPATGRRLASARAARPAAVVGLAARNVRGNGSYGFTLTSPSRAVARFAGTGRGAGPMLAVRYREPAQRTVAPPAPSSAPPPAGPPADPQSPGCTVSALLVPSCGVWIGADPGGLAAGEPKGTALGQFESEIGRPVDIVHSYHVGAQRFPTSTEIAEATQPAANRMLLINWKPELGDTWAQVAAGDPRVDANIDQEAAYIKAHFASTFFLAIHHEPEDEVIETPGSGYTASDYAAMYRHVEDRLRSDGVTNIVYVMNYMGYYRWGEQPWFTQLYPGNSYVDWISWDPYTTAATDADDFSKLLDSPHGSWPGFYNWVTSFAPGKPLMLSEWGVATSPSVSPDRKPWFFGTVATQLSSFPALKALVYFDSYAGTGTPIASSPQSADAFALLAHQPEFGAAVPAQQP